MLAQPALHGRREAPRLTAAGGGIDDQTDACRHQAKTSVPGRGTGAVRQRRGARAIAPAPSDGRGYRERGDHYEQAEQDRRGQSEPSEGQ